MPLLTDPTDSMNFAQRDLETRGAVYDGSEFAAQVQPVDATETYAPEPVFSHSPELETVHATKAAQDAHAFAIPGQEHYAPAPQPEPEAPQQPIHSMEYATTADALADVKNSGATMELIRSQYDLEA